VSHGPGKWQRVILDALETSEWCYLHDLIPNKRKVRYTCGYTPWQSAHPAGDRVSIGD
jgi:hypothetical protein